MKHSLFRLKNLFSRTKAIHARIITSCIGIRGLQWHSPCNEPHEKFTARDGCDDEQGRDVSSVLPSCNSYLDTHHIVSSRRLLLADNEISIWKCRKRRAEAPRGSPCSDTLTRVISSKSLRILIHRENTSPRSLSFRAK